MSATIIDQVGVMNIIDKMRIENTASIELADNNSRKILEDKIRAAYKKEGTIVSDQTIEEGVNRWFESRLRIKDFKEGLIWKIYLSRQKWGRVVVASIVMVSLGLGIAYGVQRANERYKKNEFLEFVASTNITLKDMESDRAILIKKIEELNGTIIGSESLKASFDSKISIVELNSRMDYLKIKVKEIENQAVDITKDVSLISNNQTFIDINSLLKEARSLIDSNNGFISQYVEGNLIVLQYQRRWEEGEFKGKGGELPVVQNMKLAVDTSIAGLTLSGVEKLKRRTNEFYRSYEKAITAEKEAEAVSEKVNSIISLMVNEDEKQILRELGDSMVSSIMNLQGASEEDKDLLSYYSDIIQREIRLIANTNGKTGIERKYDASGGKSWYILCEAVDSNNRKVKLSIESSENKIKKLVGVFGVGVTQEKYQSVKRDKTDNGLIEDNVFGTKEVGRIAFDMVDGTESRYILEW